MKITNQTVVGRTQKAKKSKSRQMKRAINRLVPNLPKRRVKAEGFGAQ